jgi:hypothetical protein
VLLDMERALNQHEFSCPAIGARDEIHLCKWNEIVGGYGQGLGKRRSCQRECYERYRQQQA